jgi:hypothetical protein
MTASEQMQEGLCAVDKALSWYGWGSPIGLSLGIGVLLLSACGSTYLLHLAGLF